MLAAMRRALWLTATLALLSACGGPSPAPVPPKTPETHEQVSVLERLAREIDPGPQPPLWQQVVAELRAKVELDAPRDAAPEARVKAARDRLENWSLQVSTTEPAALEPRVQRALEGIYLLEALALSEDTGPSAVEARAMLWEFYRAFSSMAPMIKAFQAGWAKEMANKLATSVAVVDLFEKAGPKMIDHLAARILRAGSPPRAVDDVLWQKATAKADAGDVEGARALYAEYVRRSRTSTSAEDALRAVHAYLRLEDMQAASAALDAAKANAPADDRRFQARLRAAEHDRDAVARLVALTKRDTPDALAQYDLLFELGRVKEAEAVLEALARKRPKDARVRARQVQLRVNRGQFDEHLGDLLRDPDLTDLSAEYWSMRAGAAGMALMRAAPTPAALRELAQCAGELARFQPSRAAAFQFLLERVSRMLEKPLDAKSLVEAVRGSFDDALALRGKYPEEPDVDRIVLALSLFTADANRGLQAALARPKTAPDDDVELYVQRARVAVALAAYAGKTADLSAVRRAVEDIAPTTDAETEAAREALLGDVDALAATVGGDRAAWPRAAARYESALRLGKQDRARLQDNLAFIAGATGDATKARALFEAAARENSGRRWVPLLNLSTLPGTSKDDELAAIRAIAGPANAEPPALVNVWRASLEPSADEARLAAAKAIAELDAPMSFHKYELHARGLESEGSFALGLGLRSGRLGYVLNVSAHVTLWLVRPAPLSRADLEAKAKGAAAKKKK
jgi:tetratricopeptide (TPR) repeat protein